MKRESKEKAKPIDSFGCWMKDREANAATTLAQLLRGSKPMKLKCSESMRVVEAVVDAAQATAAPGIYTPSMKVVLITEGLGNRVNMNYYGPEAIASAPAIFEGKPCYLDHPTVSDARDIPERRVKDKCGYFKNCHIESMGGRTALVGELFFDISDSGRLGYQKALTALKYRQEFPTLDSEYVGLSINADGETEERRVVWESEALDVNYVTRFTGAGSCDIVTTPARGGRFLALVESAAGAKTRKEESMNKTLEEALKAAHTALEEANNETDAAAKATKVAEAHRLFGVFLSEAKKSADDKEESAAESNSDEMESDIDEKKKESKKKEKADKKDDEDDDSDAVESKRLAVASLAKESGVDLPEGTLAKLAAMPLKEAKVEIAELKQIVESTAKKVINGMAVPAANFASMTEAERKEAGSENNKLFAGLVG